MAQQVIPTAQLVPIYHTIRRCTNYTMLQSIPCSPECKIVGQILLDHPLGYALTATADVHTMYLQQFLRIVSKVHGPENMNKFMLNTQEFIYTVDMFRDILHLPVETPENPFVTPVNIETIKAFMNMVTYQGMVDKVSAFYTKNLAQPWKTMFKVFNRFLTTRTSRHDQTKINILQMFQDDIPLVSVYTTGNVLVRGILISDAFLTEEIRATYDFKEYETVFINVVILMNQPQPVVSTQGTHRSTPRAYKTPNFIAIPQEKEEEVGCWRIQFTKKITQITIKKEKQCTPSIPPPKNDKERDEIFEDTPLKEEIKKMVEDEESYVSEFDDSILNGDFDDFGTKIEPESHKENPENVDDDDKEIEKEKKDEGIEKEEKDDTVEKTDEVDKEKDIVIDVTGSMEIKKEQKHT
nr:hypothetical protein [Tanacetum cinerariifolium]